MLAIIYKNYNYCRINSIHFYGISGDDDIAISSICFTKDRHKLIAGFKNGLIRVYPLKSNPEADFDLHMLGPYWEHNMHDNDSGKLFQIYIESIFNGIFLQEQ